MRTCLMWFAHLYLLAFPPLLSNFLLLHPEIFSFIFVNPNSSSFASPIIIMSDINPLWATALIPPIFAIFWYRPHRPQQIITNHYHVVPAPAISPPSTGLQAESLIPQSQASHLTETVVENSEAEKPVPTDPGPTQTVEVESQSIAPHLLAKKFLKSGLDWPAYYEERRCQNSVYY